MFDYIERNQILINKISHIYLNLFLIFFMLLWLWSYLEFCDSSVTGSLAAYASSLSLNSFKSLLS